MWLWCNVQPIGGGGGGGDGGGGHTAGLGQKPSWVDCERSGPVHQLHRLCISGQHLPGAGNRTHTESSQLSGHNHRQKNKTRMMTCFITCRSRQTHYCQIPEVGLLIRNITGINPSLSWFWINNNVLRLIRFSVLCALLQPICFCLIAG